MKTAYFGMDKMDQYVYDGAKILYTSNEIKIRVILT